MVIYPIAFCCIAVTKLLVVDRMMDFSKLKGVGKSSRWATLSRVLVVIIILGNVVGLISVIPASVLFSEAVSASQDNRSAYIDEIVKAANVGAIHLGAETIMLLLIVVAVVVVGLASARRIHAALGAVQSPQMQALVPSERAPASATRQSIAARRATLSGMHLRRQIVGTCCVVFVSFLVRAVYTTMFALSLFFNDISNDPEVTDNRCEGDLNDYSLILVWLLYRPEIFFCVVLLCQPIALLASLWGMTSGQMLAIMRSNYEGMSIPAD